LANQAGPTPAFTRWGLDILVVVNTRRGPVQRWAKLAVIAAALVAFLGQTGEFQAQGLASAIASLAERPPSFA